jgi:hypothetical protein
MTALQRLIRTPHLLEVHRIDLAAPALDFRVIGPFSRFIRRSLLRSIARRATGSGAIAPGRAA